MRLSLSPLPLLLLIVIGSAPVLAVDADALDLVVLDNRQRLRGTITDADRPDRITIKTAGGSMTIQRSRVVAIDLGVTSRVAYTAPDDAQGLYDLALWCQANDHDTQALEALTKAIALPGCPLPARGLHARLVDKLKGPEAALPLYRAWRTAGGDDPTHLARLAQLEAITGPLDPNRPPPAPPAVVTQPTPPTPKGLDAGWRAEAPDFANTTQVEPSTLPDEDGKDIAGVRVLAAAGAKGKAAIRRSVRLDLSDPATSTLSFRAQNPGTQDLALTLAVKTGSGWGYFEALPQQIGRAHV